jgi:hypothetical protein
MMIVKNPLCQPVGCGLLPGAPGFQQAQEAMQDEAGEKEIRER